MEHISHRPWGTYEVLLDADNCKVKRIIVYPGQRLSLQYHNKRRERWTVVEGQLTALVESHEHTLNSGMGVSIPMGGIHRAENRTNKDVVFIEVQTGTYFGEDDIVRIEDDYKRN